MTILIEQIRITLNSILRREMLSEIVNAMSGESKQDSFDLTSNFFAEY